MKRTFVAVKEFKTQVDGLGDGDLIKGTGAIRKIRIAAKGKGKSGGLRVFYLDIPTKEKCYLLFLLEKSESENITEEEKVGLKKLVRLSKE